MLKLILIFLFFGTEFSAGLSQGIYGVMLLITAVPAARQAAWLAHARQAAAVVPDGLGAAACSQPLLAAEGVSWGDICLGLRRLKSNTLPDDGCWHAFPAWPPVSCPGLWQTKCVKSSWGSEGTSLCFYNGGERERGTNVCQALGLCNSQSAVLPYAGDLIYGSELWTAVAASCDFCHSCRAVTAASRAAAVISFSTTISDCHSWAWQILFLPAGFLCSIPRLPARKSAFPPWLWALPNTDSVTLGLGVQAHAGAVVRLQGIMLWEENKPPAAADCRAANSR